METRKIENRKYIPNKDANNYYAITCPFCGQVTEAQVRGYYARGRKCQGCKAIFKGDLAIMRSKK